MNGDYDGVHADGLETMIRVIALCFALLYSSTLGAATYYVATDGSDRARGTEDRPFRTITRGLRELQAGDTLIVRDATFSPGILLSERFPN